MLSGQYLLFGYWDLAQRESFFDWFMLPSVALQLVAQAPPTRRDRARSDGGARRQAVQLGVVGALSLLPWFGKPTYALFTFAQLAAIAADDELVLPRRKALGSFAIGGALSAAIALAWLAARGDVMAFVHIQLSDVPALYRFLWPRAAADIFSNPWCATQAIFAITGAVLLLSLVWLGEMPRSVIALALVPVCALASVVAAGEGVPVPLSSGHRGRAPSVARRSPRGSPGGRASPAGARRSSGSRRSRSACVIALRVATAMEDSPHVRAVWLLWSGATPAERTTREYFAHFPETDFFPFELRQTAAYLRDHTRSDERVQVYGMDPYVLFLARRLSATPYIYAYDLDVDAALAGGTGGVPDDAQAERIRAIRDAHEADLLDRLEARPPAAFVFLDGSPLISESDAWGDFEAHCTRAAPWVRANYRESVRFGHDHVWLRSDLAPAAPAPDESSTPDEQDAP